MTSEENELEFIRSQARNKAVDLYIDSYTPGSLLTLKAMVECYVAGYMESHDISAGVIKSLIGVKQKEVKDDLP